MEYIVTEQMEILIYQIKELESSYRKIVKNYEVSYNEFWIWYGLITMKEVYSQQDICDIWGLPKQTVNNIVTSMVKKGFVTLEPIPNTKNRKNICLTKEGREYGEKLVLPICNAERRAFDNITLEEMVAVSNVLEKLMKSLVEEVQE